MSREQTVWGAIRARAAELSDEWQARCGALEEAGAHEIEFVEFTAGMRQLQEPPDAFYVTGKLMALAWRGRRVFPRRQHSVAVEFGGQPPDDRPPKMLGRVGLLGRFGGPIVVG